MCIRDRDKSHPVVSLQYWVGTGSMNEGHWQGSGRSHLLEHLVFKGTEHYSGQDLARKVQELSLIHSWGGDTG